MDGSATCTGPASPDASSTPAPARPRGTCHLWVPRDLGNAGLLLGLVLDGDRWPDAPTFTACRIGCSDDSVRRMTSELARRGLVEQRDGFLVATTAGRARLRRCDPLPRRLLRPGVAGRTLAVLRAAAVLYGETLGMRAHRHGVRGDRERADLAGVHRETVAKARTLLASVGLATFAEARRGRALLVRAAAVTDATGRPVGSHGRPLGKAARERAADAAAKHRGTTAETGRVTTAETGPPIQCSSSTLPMQPATPAGANGSKRASLQDGCPAEPIRQPQPERSGRSQSVADVLNVLVPDLPAAEATRAATVTSSSEKARTELARIAADPQAVPKLLRMLRQKAVEQVLAAAQVFDRSPKRRAGLAVQVARVLAPEQVLALAVDVVLGKPRNIAAVLLGRLKRAMAGKGELLTWCRASWPIGRFLDTLREGGDARVAPLPRGCAPAASRPAAPRSSSLRPPAPSRPDDGPLSFDHALRSRGLGGLVGRAAGR